MTTPVQLDGDGPFELPAVSGFLGLTILADRPQVQTLRFVLEGGSELHLPIAGYAYEKLLGQFAGQYALLQQAKGES